MLGGKESAAAPASVISSAGRCSTLTQQIRQNPQTSRKQRASGRPTRGTSALRHAAGSRKDSLHMRVCQRSCALTLAASMWLHWSAPDKQPAQQKDANEERKLDRNQRDPLAEPSTAPRLGPAAAARTRHRHRSAGRRRIACCAGQVGPAPHLHSDGPAWPGSWRMHQGSCRLCSLRCGVLEFVRQLFTCCTLEISNLSTGTPPRAALHGS